MATITQSDRFHSENGLTKPKILIPLVEPVVNADQLGPMTDFATPGTSASRRRRAFTLQDGAGRLGFQRVADCGRHRISPEKPVALVLETGPSTSRAWLTGTRTCGSARTCAHCGARIAHGRAVELEAAVRAHHLAGGRVLLITTTTAHHKKMDLTWQADTFLRATRAMKSGKGYATLTAGAGFIGEVRGLECTFGRAGVHLHAHTLAFVGANVDPVVIEMSLKSRWARMVHREGLGRVDDDHLLVR